MAQRGLDLQHRLLAAVRRAGASLRAESRGRLAGGLFLAPLPLSRRTDAALEHTGATAEERSSVFARGAKSTRPCGTGTATRPFRGRTASAAPHTRAALLSPPGAWPLGSCLASGLALRATVQTDTRRSMVAGSVARFSSSPSMQKRPTRKGDKRRTRSTDRSTDGTGAKRDRRESQKQPATVLLNRKRRAPAANGPRRRASSAKRRSGWSDTRLSDDPLDIPAGNKEEARKAQLETLLSMPSTSWMKGDSVMYSRNPVNSKSMVMLRQTVDDFMRLDLMKSTDAKSVAVQRHLSLDDFEASIEVFTKYILSAPTLPSPVSKTLIQLRNWSAFTLTERKHLTQDLMSFCIDYFRSSKPASVDEVMKVTDMRLPHEWYEQARATKRTIYFHGGPTNSGKTYSAMQRFKASSAAIYCAPLRLLALEIFELTNAENIPCDLLTGEERRRGQGRKIEYSDTSDVVEPSDSAAPSSAMLDVRESAAPQLLPFRLKHGGSEEEFVHSSAHLSCTVEMANTKRRWDVAVIDEIQMIADESRGWAWTRALLGLNATEVHLCGEMRALNIVRKILEPIGEEVVVREYARLSPVEFASTGLHGSLESVRPGDAVIAFSRRDLFSLKHAIESTSPHRCAVIYGSLPAGTRSLQARLFNSQEKNFDVLVATDAVGMGLNLNIGRIIFSAAQKFDGKSNRPLTPSEVRQIGGRAGRFRSMFPKGTVTSLFDDDFGLLRSIYKQEPRAILRAGIQPPYEQILRFSMQFPNLPLSDLMTRFEAVAQLSDTYFMCDMTDRKVIADNIEHLDLPLQDRWIFTLSPASVDDDYLLSCLKLFARKVSERSVVSLKELRLPTSFKASEGVLSEFEQCHKMLDLYLWLSYHFPKSFLDTKVARQLQLECQSRIQEILVEQSRANSHSSFHGKRKLRR